MYNVGDKIEFINLARGPWLGAHAIVEKVEGNYFWFRRDDGAKGGLHRDSFAKYTKLLVPFSLENK